MNYRTDIPLLFLILSACSFAADCPPRDGSPDAQQMERFDRQGQTEFRRGDFSGAAGDFGRAACLAPANLVGIFELLQSAAAAMGASDFSRAISALKDADRSAPGYTLALAMLVKVELLAGDDSDLKATLRELARRFPGDGRLHAGLVQDLLQASRHDLALAEALRFEQTGTEDSRAMLNLAVLENQAGALEDAARVAISLEEARQIPSKTRSSGAAVAGLSYEGLGQLPEATTHFRTAIELDPGAPNAYLALARIYGVQQNHEQALAVLELAQKNVPGSRQILLALGSAQVAVDRFAAARDTLAGLLDRFPDEWEAYLKLAAAYRNSGEPVMATQTLRRLADRQSNYPRLHIVIAESMLDENPVDYFGVLQELAKAETASGQDYDIFYLKGRVYVATVRYDQAIDAFQRAIVARPTDPSAYYQLAMAYRKSGRSDLAKEQFARMQFLKGN